MSLQTTRFGWYFSITIDTRWRASSKVARWAALRSANTVSACSRSLIASEASSSTLMCFIGTWPKLPSRAASTKSLVSARISAGEVDALYASTSGRGSWR